MYNDTTTSTNDNYFVNQLQQKVNIVLN
jgi:hypothetical protein